MRVKNKKARKFLNSLSLFFLRRWVVFPSIPVDNKVLFFKRDRHDFGFLSNFYICSLEIDGEIWPHVEAYYQAQKSGNPEYHKEI